MEGVGSRLGRASARYGPTQAVFNGPVRKWKKRWVHVSSSSSSTSSSSSVTAASQSNGHNISTTTTTGNGTPLLLCKWTPLSSNPSDINGGAPPEDPPPPKRRFRYTPIAVLEERKKALEEKVEEEARESETNLFTDLSTSKTIEMNSETALKKETQTQDSNTSHLDLGLCLQGGDHDSDSPSKEDQLIKSTIGDLF
ncbi:hypothetical protein ACOSP7_030302 [Xanthoceras sorbifolium]